MKIRIDRLLANMGYGSRKEVRLHIRKGNVLVNNKVIKTAKAQVNPEKDIVTIFGERVHYRKYIYLMLNKPKGYLSATRDFHQPTVLDLLPEKYSHFQPFPIGRLDKDTEGLLLISNDGQLAHELTSPKKDIEKIYFAEIKGKVTKEDISTFEKGVVLDDGYVTKPAKLTILQSDHLSKIRLAITEGKYHQVKRMFESIGKKVLYLQRIQMGEIKLDPRLEIGELRELSKEEMEYCLSLKKL